MCLVRNIALQITSRIARCLNPTNRYFICFVATATLCMISFIHWQSATSEFILYNAIDKVMRGYKEEGISDVAKCISSLDFLTREIYKQQTMQFYKKYFAAKLGHHQRLFVLCLGRTLPRCFSDMLGQSIPMRQSNYLHFVAVEMWRRTRLPGWIWRSTLWLDKGIMRQVWRIFLWKKSVCKWLQKVSYGLELFIFIKF